MLEPQRAGGETLHTRRVETMQLTIITLTTVVDIAVIILLIIIIKINNYYCDQYLGSLQIYCTRQKDPA